MSEGEAAPVHSYKKERGEKHQPSYFRAATAAVTMATLLDELIGSAVGHL